MYRRIISLCILICLTFIVEIIGRDIIPFPQSRQTLIVRDGDLFYDFGGPFDYTNCFCITTTTLFGGTPFSLDFTEFAIDAPGDNITIYDGATTSDPVLYTNNSGDPFTADRTLAAFIATNGSSAIRGSTPSLTIKFTADFFRGNTGFVAEISLDPCLPEWNLSGNIIGGTYRALDSINTDGIVQASTAVTLQSYNFIQFNKNFEVEHSGVLEANNEGCN